VHYPDFRLIQPIRGPHSTLKQAVLSHLAHTHSPQPTTHSHTISSPNSCMLTFKLPHVFLG